MQSLFSSNTLSSYYPNIPPLSGDLPDVPPLSGDLPQTSSQTPKNNPTSDYLNTIQKFKQQLPAILDDFKKYYVFYSKNPTYNEYQSIFDNLKSNLKEIENELIKISNGSDINISQITNKLLEINKLIEKEKTRNNKLKSSESQYNNEYNGSKELIDNYKEIYNWNYLMNIFIVLGVIITIILLVRLFAKKNNIVKPQ